MAQNSSGGKQDLYGLVDMGSNGIRFSISNLSPPTTRILPTLYTSRAGISLYDAQYSPSGEPIPIPDTTIRAVTNQLVRFKRTCASFGVPSQNVTVLATEATRTALNSEEFRGQIRTATGWDVTMLCKQEEGRVGALGVATSLGTVEGLVMDLGGGSTQLTWLTTTTTGSSDGAVAIKMPATGAVSMPFGAAALMRRLEEAQKEGGAAKQRFADEVKQTIRKAYESLAIPAELDDLAKDKGGFALYLSGGGFRGWGFVLMSQHPVQPYPIPVINGLVVERDVFLDTASVQAAVKDDIDNDDDAIFRVSQRRASQVPAVAFLVKVLSEALPQINQVRFCQGGVREGFLFSTLPDHVRNQQPITVATQPFASPSAAHFSDLLQTSLPPPTSSSAAAAAASPQNTFTPAILAALANMLNYFSTHPKDIRAASALRCTTTGVLASAHGLAHEERALLALALCERWGGGSDLPPADQSFFRSMRTLVGAWGAWWARYVGSVAALVGDVYPSGSGDQVLVLDARWGVTGKGNEQIVLQARAEQGGDVRELFADQLERIKKAGKKKNWIGGKDGCGHKVDVS